MDTIAKRLKAARAARNISQAKLAQLIKSSQSSIGSIESGRNQGSGLLIHIAAALQVNPVWLATGKGSMEDAAAPGNADATPPSAIAGGDVRVWSSPDDLPPDDDRVWVDRWDYRVSAGHGGVQWEIRQKDALPFNMAFFRAVGSKPANCKLLMVRGDSMEPFLFNRDMVMVDTSRTAVRDGLIYAVGYEDEALVKQIFKETGGGLVLHSYNPRFPDRRVGPEEMSRIKIIGEVVYRSGSGFASN